MAAVVSGLIAAAVLAAPFLAARYLTSPALSKIGAPPADIGAETVSIEPAVGPAVAGWFADPGIKRAAVLLTHGIHGNREQIVERQRLFHAAGYATLAIDLQAHGESSGDRITFGYRERKSVDAAAAWLRAKLPGRKIAGVGLSLGGAALILGPLPPSLDAYVLEAVYSDIRNATADRLTMRIGDWGRVLLPVVVWPTAILLGLWPSELRPVAAIGRVRAPVLVIGGVEDRHTPIADTRALYAAAAEPKELWEISGAAHTDFERHVPGLYRDRVLDFLTRHLD